MLPTCEYKRQGHEQTLITMIGKAAVPIFDDPGFNRSGSGEVRLGDPQADGPGVPSRRPGHQVPISTSGSGCFAL